MRIRRAAPVPTLAIFTFHRIADPDPDDPFDLDVIDGTPARFRRFLEMIARSGTPIGMEALLAGLDGAALPPNPIMITFDDGYRSCRETVLPILQELGVPATFFIATAFPDAGSLYWWEQIALILRGAGRRFGRLAYPTALTIDAHDPQARRVLDDIVKNTRQLDLERFLGELRTAFEVAWSPAIEAELAKFLIMGWDDIRALEAAGMDLESHTRQHHVLETLDDAALRDELVGSRRDLEERLGRPVRAIAYPVGRPPSPRVQRAVADAGYRVAFANSGGVNHVGRGVLRSLTRVDALALRRQTTVRTQSDSMFATQIALPMLAH
jgi:peptidoglycan/xylan/chitin deacetylase (PgdA/CDA1 family)